MSKSYVVTWEIDIEANSPTEAAEQALAIQRNPESIATFFHVEDMEECVTWDVDLWEDTTEVQ